MQVYIAGPMTGLPNFNYPAFHEAARILRARFPARTFINPAENYNGDQTLKRSDYFRAAIPQVMSSDAVVVLPDWWSSQGALLEVSIARSLGISIYTIDAAGDLLPLGPTPSVEWVAAWHDEHDEADEADETASLTGSEDVLDDEPDESILVEAERLVTGDRAAQYGHPSADFTATGRIAGAVLGRWFDNLSLSVVDLDNNEVEFPDVEPRIVAMLLIGVKLSREASRPKRDNRVDGVGYFHCMDEVVRAEGRNF